MITESETIKPPPPKNKKEPQAKTVPKDDEKNVERPKFDEVDQASKDSFPASDPPGWWS